MQLPRQSGIALLEIMLVIGVVIVAATATSILGGTVMAQGRAHLEGETLSDLIYGVENAYSGTSNFRFLDNQAAITQHLVPKAMLQPGGIIQSRWGSPITIQAVAARGRPDAGFRVTYASVPQSICAPFVRSAWELLHEVRVNGRLVATRPDGINTAQLVDACALGGDVAFDVAPFQY